MTRKCQKGSLLSMGKAVLILSKNLHIFQDKTLCGPRMNGLHRLLLQRCQAMDMDTSYYYFVVLAFLAVYCPPSNTQQDLRVRKPICLPRSLQACASYPLPLSALSLARPPQEIPASRPEIPLLWCQPRVEPQGSPPAQVPGLLPVHSEAGSPAAWFSWG